MINDNDNEDFHKFVNTEFSGSVGDLDLQKAKIKIYPLIGKNSDDEYLIYIIKTAIGNKGDLINEIPYTVNIGSL